MKYLVIMFALISLAACSTENEINQEDLASIIKNCEDKFGVTVDEKKDMKEHKPDSNQVKSMRACILKDTAVMNEEGIISIVATKKLVKLYLEDKASEEVVTRLGDACGSDEPNSDHPEAASKHAQCLRTELAAFEINDCLY